jgi:predicted alpha/beta superfamily hydrolase
MQDGENLFDPKTSSFGTDWQLDEAADSLIKNGTIKDLIIIGIYNTSDRSMEYRDTPEGKSYMNFVVHKVKPLIDKKYRTLPGRENTAVGGSSLGGLISFMLAWKYPGVFSGAACLSPAFDIEDINYIPAVINYSGKKKAVKFYIDCGTAGLDAKLLPGSEEMIRELENKGYKSGKDILFYKAEGAKHNEAAWSKRNPRYLEFLFGRSK